MNKMFSQLLDDCVVVFLDDVLVFSKTLEDHNRHLRIVCDLFRKHQFYAKLKKCELYRRRVTFLGHDVDEDGLHVNSNKAKMIQTWPVPKNISELRSFLGFA